MCIAHILAPLANSLPRNFELLLQFAGRRSCLKPFAHLGFDHIRVVPREANFPDVVFEASDLPKAFPGTSLVAADSQIAGNGFVASAVLEDLKREFFKKKSDISAYRPPQTPKIRRAGFFIAECKKFASTIDEFCTNFVGCNGEFLQRRIKLRA